MKPRAARPSPARQRLLEAASRVFARDGLSGATTREIAREAAVNEVTLFRHFQTKGRLLAAVVGREFGPSASPTKLRAPEQTGSLRDDLTAHARQYEKVVQQNLPLIRTMVGEIHHHGEHEAQVFNAIFRPLRAALVGRLEAAVAAGELRDDVDALILADLFVGMLFTGVLRRASANWQRQYSAAVYLAAAVDLVMRGAATGASERLV